jgi:hypothetical protein
MTMTRARRQAALLVTTVGVGWLASAAHAQDAERIAMSRVRLTTEPALVQGCARLGTARDDSLKDLRRKIVRFGGNTGLLTFGGLEDLEIVFAEVFRCGEPPAAAPGTAPARVPVPPAGPPPPPPPPPTR